MASKTVIRPFYVWRDSFAQKLFGLKDSHSDITTQNLLIPAFLVNVFSLLIIPKIYYPKVIAYNLAVTDNKGSIHICGSPE